MGLNKFSKRHGKMHKHASSDRTQRANKRWLRLIGNRRLRYLNPVDEIPSGNFYRRLVDRWDFK